MKLVKVKWFECMPKPVTICNSYRSLERTDYNRCMAYSRPEVILWDARVTWRFTGIGTPSSGNVLKNEAEILKYRGFIVKRIACGVYRQVTDYWSDRNRIKITCKWSPLSVAHFCEWETGTAINSDVITSCKNYFSCNVSLKTFSICC